MSGAPKRNSGRNPGGKGKRSKKSMKTRAGSTMLVLAVAAFAFFFKNSGQCSNLEALIRGGQTQLTASYETTADKLPEDVRLELSRCENDSAILSRTYYTVGYNKDAKQPNWVGYYISSGRLDEGNESRSEDFREDESIAENWRSRLSDYRRSGYDRGHLAPAADFKFSPLAMSETFLLSNISPQLHEYNAGIWLIAEKVARRNAYESGDIYVVTGPIFGENPQANAIGESKVWVPEAFYKVFLVYNENEKKGIGFIIPHEKGKFKNLAYYAMSIDDVEKATGIDFFCNLPDEDENEIEARFNAADWTMREYQF